MLAMNKWNPWSELADLHRDLDAIVGRMFQDGGGRSSTLGSLGTGHPPVDMTREDDGWKVVMPVPGIAPSELEIDVEGRNVRIRGEHRENGDEHRDGYGYGRVDQQLTLPDDIDTEKVAARYQLGVLELTLPLKESARPRRIEVQASPETKQLKAA
jgi:HSP20 family protein